MRRNFENTAFGKVFRALRESDIALEVVDARDVEGTRLARMDRMLKSKIVIAATKSDLVPGIGREGRTKDGQRIIFLSARSGKGKKMLLEEIERISGNILGAIKRRKHRKREKRLADKSPDSRTQDEPGNVEPAFRETVKIMVFGIPNVGKSTLINMIAGKSVARTGFRVGITRGAQWISLGNGMLLCDLPGVIPKNSSKEGLALKAAFDVEKLKDPQGAASQLVQKFIEEKKRGLAEFYGIEMDEKPEEVLFRVAKRRNFLLKGGEIDIYQAALVVIRDFQRGKFKL